MAKKTGNKGHQHISAIATGVSPGACRKNNYALYKIAGETYKYPNDRGQAQKMAKSDAENFDIHYSYDVTFYDGKTYKKRHFEDLEDPKQARKYQSMMNSNYNKNRRELKKQRGGKSSGYRKLNNREDTVVRKDIKRTVGKPKLQKEANFIWNCEIKMGNIVFVKKYYKKPKKGRKTKSHKGAVHTESCAPIEADYRVCFCMNEKNQKEIVRNLKGRIANGMIIPPGEEGKVLDTVKDINKINFIWRTEHAKARQKGTGAKYKVVWVDECPSG